MAEDERSRAETERFHRGAAARGKRECAQPRHAGGVLPARRAARPDLSCVKSGRADDGGFAQYHVSPLTYVIDEWQDGLDGPGENGLRNRDRKRDAAGLGSSYLSTMDRRQILLGALALPLAAAFPAMAQSVNATAIDAYLRGLRTAQGSFRQVNPNRSTQTGRFYLSKPGRIRFDYDRPEGAMVIADGSYVGVFDPKSNRNPTRYPLGSTPLRMLLDPNVSLRQPGMVLGATKDASGTHITLVDPKSPKDGRLVLTFSESPVMLRSWDVITKTGQRTHVDVTRLTQNVSLSSSLFNIQAEAARYR
jgi:outer membrane lipoprotein-sorting protein